MQPDLDIDAGFTVFREDNPIMRLFNVFFDNGKRGFVISYLDDSHKHCQEILNHDLWIENDDSAPSIGGKYSLYNHLTGHRIPDEKYNGGSGWPSEDYQFLILGFRLNTPKPKKLPRTIRGGVQHLLTGLRNLPKGIKDYFVSSYVSLRTSENDRLEKRYEELCKYVENNLLKQDFAVIDLRRGVMLEHVPGGHIYRNYTDLDMPCFRVPLKPEFLININSIALALPGKGESQYYRLLRSYIDPLKVVELTIFDLENLLDFEEYKNIRFLCIFGCKNVNTINDTGIFPFLEKINYLGIYNPSSIEGLREDALKKGIELTIHNSDYLSGV